MPPEEATPMNDDDGKFVELVYDYFLKMYGAKPRKKKPAKVSKMIRGTHKEKEVCQKKPF